MWPGRIVLLGEIAAGRTPPDRALAMAHYQDALATAIELGMRPLAAHCHVGLAQLGTGGGRALRTRGTSRPQPACSLRWGWYFGFEGRAYLRALQGRGRGTSAALEADGRLSGPLA